MYVLYVCVLSEIAANKPFMLSTSDNVPHTQKLNRIIFKNHLNNAQQIEHRQSTQSQQCKVHMSPYLTCASVRM